MSVNSDFKLIKEKKLDKSTILKVSENLMSGRIFVEFTSKSPNITLQKNFQNTFDGRKDSELFAKSIRNTTELIEYFGFRKN
jgi:hypothetical protein